MDNSRRQLVKLYLDNLQVQVQEAGYNQVWTDWRELDYTPNYNKFYLIYDGEGWLKIGDKEYAPKPGQWFLMPHGVKQSFSYTSGPRYTKYWCHFTAKVGENNLFHLLKHPAFIESDGDSEPQGLFQELLSYKADASLTASLHARTAMMKLIAYYIEHAEIQAIQIVDGSIPDGIPDHSIRKESSLMTDNKEAWATEIADHLKRQFGLSVSQAAPIDKGWLNVKWRMETDLGPVFVKFYHPERYKLHLHPARKIAIQRTLELQRGLSLSGVRCPSVYSSTNQFLQETSTGLHYAVLDWVEGYTLPAGSLNEAQMHELGQHTGKMHKWLRSVQRLDKLAWQPDKEGYVSEWQSNWHKAQEAGDEIVLEWLGRSRLLVESLDYRSFDACPVGWLHWDLWVDNILVNEQGLAGIVDFDRMTMAYPEIDVTRAILSGALLNGKLRIDAVQAFLEGYREYVDFPQGVLARSMCLLYLIESIWWLRTEVRAESGLRGLLGRFIEEMHWIEQNWETLRDQLNEI